MPLVEGVGDEVIQFVAIVFVMLVAALAWWSTNARPDRYRTVLVMRTRAHHPVTVSIRTRSSLMLTNTPNNATQGSTADTTVANPSDAVNDTSNPRVIPLQEMDSIVDADMAMLDHNRLHFYRRMDSPNTVQSTVESTSDESEVPEESEPASTAQIREMDRIVSAMEADVTTGCEFFARPNEANATSTTEKKDENKPPTENVETTGPQSTDNATSDAVPNDPVEVDRQKILIKLKYLNDTLKEVEGSLDELLKDFKWRHFSSELTAESRVRLIFNGRVLLDDAATLRACGLHDRAVVHCLVHPKRAASQQRGGLPEDSTAGTHELVTEAAAAERAWDLENILMTLVSVALTVLWFFRCEYSTMFTASASVALFGLTVFYSIAIFGLYLSDTFQLERRPAQPQPPPNN